MTIENTNFSLDFHGLPAHKQWWTYIQVVILTSMGNTDVFVRFPGYMLLPLQSCQNLCERSGSIFDFVIKIVLQHCVSAISEGEKDFSLGRVTCWRVSGSSGVSAMIVVPRCRYPTVRCEITILILLYMESWRYLTALRSIAEKNSSIRRRSSCNSLVLVALQHFGHQPRTIKLTALKFYCSHYLNDIAVVNKVNFDVAPAKTGRHDSLTTLGLKGVKEKVYSLC